MREMEQVNKMKTFLPIREKSFFVRHKGIHIYTLIAAGLVGVCFALRKSTGLVDFYHTRVGLPSKQFLARLCDICPYSIGEIMIFLAIALAVFYIIRAIRDITRAKNRRRVIYRRTMIALCSLLTLAFLLEISIGAANFAGSFQDKSGIRAQATSSGALYAVASYFAYKANRSGELVQRGHDGVFNRELEDIIRSSVGIYDSLEARFPFLEMRDVKPKRLLLSKLMSASGYTGYYFPLTGEANINVDAPLCLIPSTIAHEFAHQRGVMHENEANFVAVLACTLSDDISYEYSGWLLGYIYLSNALLRQDGQLWQNVQEMLSEGVVADLRENRSYWTQFENKTVSKVSDAVYSAYLKSSGQELGLQSYGAVVDLLIAYYKR